MGGVLEGVRVLDFGRYIAGPYCATLLAEFGAEVIRVEKRDGSEDRFVAPVGEGGEGALFLQINRNKKCITLDPMKAEGQEVLRRLVARSDVVVERGSVLSMGVYIGISTKIVDRATGEVHYGRVPAYSVVVSGTLPGKPLPNGQPGPGLYCAVIVKRVDEKTRAKTSINELLRD